MSEARRGGRTNVRRGAGLGAVALGIAACLAPRASAESIFASTGFGHWASTVDARSAGMGDVSIVGAARFAFGPRNPSMLAYLDRATGYAEMSFDFTRVNAGGPSETRPDARIPLLAAGAPLGSGFAGSIAIHERSNGRYALTLPVGGDPGYELRMRGEGGWTEAVAALARSFGDHAFGISLGLPFTAIDETITRDFSAEGYSDREEQLETDLDDVFFVTAGAHGTTGAFSYGAFFQLPTTATVVSRRESGGVVIEDSFELGIPPAFGAGVAMDLPGGVRVAGEYRRHPWDSAEVNGESWRDLPRPERTRGYKDQDAWGTGVEWRPGNRDETEPRRRTLVWRAGYGVEPWVTAGPSFGRVTDQKVTVGMGVPFREGNGRIDLALRYIRRRESNSDFREDVIGFMLGIAFARQPREF